MATLIQNQDTVRSAEVALYLNGTLGAVGDTIGETIDAAAYDSVSLQLLPGWVGTAQFEGTNDPSITNSWRSISLANPSGDTSTAYQSTAATSNELFSGDLGFRYFRVRVSAYTSGPVPVRLLFSPDSMSAKPRGTQGVSGTVTAAPGAASEQAETGTVLAANALYTGPARDLGQTSSGRPTLVRPMISHLAGLVPGILILQESTDAAVWRETRRSPVPSDSSYRSFEWPTHMRYYRFLFQNGPTAQTGFYLHASRIQGDGGTMDAKNNLSFLLTTTALAANGTFTSPTLDLGDNHIWSNIRARVHTDQASATDGIRIESSHDGVNWGYSAAAVMAKAADARVVSTERPITERYLRLVVANGTTAQTFLRATLALISL